ncbi:hypothetical protein IP91_04902 [Pseudoduganella lurida]|uniref:Uncharacterized protein n=1 Tax=Pseudoduganella lurida TaxID=1036180 RepID=A0A562QW02_9BURK|nr:hypothetical protein [Pseudoduganella lurida]TWI60937.1 hypothetical protein IP91_04902 [Pseudoduganella lurida]
MSDFYRYLKENMEDLGLPAPESLFGSLQAALGMLRSSLRIWTNPAAVLR